MLYSPGPVIDLMNKEPTTQDFLNWLFDVKAEWYILGQKLGVDDSDLDSLRKSPMDDAERLSRVHSYWRNGRTSDHTFKQLCSVLTTMGRNTTVKRIREKLQKPDVVERYSKEPDYKR